MYTIHSNMALSQQIYQTFMVSVAVTMGASQETAEKDMQEVHDFELQLANISSISGNISTTTLRPFSKNKSPWGLIPA